MAQAPPFGPRKGEKPDMKNPNGGAQEHLNALESLVKTPRGRAALNTLRSELSGDGDSGQKKGKPTSNAKSEALARFQK
jgi:hypothetical protein